MGRYVLREVIFKTDFQEFINKIPRKLMKNKLAKSAGRSLKN